MSDVLSRVRSRVATVVVLVVALVSVLQFTSAPRAEAAGVDYKSVESRLAQLGFDPGPVDGVWKIESKQALWAFKKSLGIEPNDDINLWIVLALMFAPRPAPLVPNGGPDRAEIDLDRQILTLYRDGNIRLITHISSGSGIPYTENGKSGDAVTPVGTFAFQRFYKGWEKSPLGQLYNPIYFVGGVAVHGANSVPLYPASHGCVRIPMHIAEYLPSLTYPGMPVYVKGRGVTPTPA